MRTDQTAFAVGAALCFSPTGQFGFNSNFPCGQNLLPASFGEKMFGEKGRNLSSFVWKFQGSDLA